jgi:hypothetical protein
MPSQGLTEDRPRPGHDVEHALGNAGLGRQLGKPQRRQRRCRSRLEDHGVTRGERRTELPGRDDERVIPRHDRTHHADRLTRHERQDIRSGRADLAVDLVDGLGVPLDRLGCGRDVDRQGVADGLPDIERLEQRQLLAAGAHRLGKLQQDDLALGRRHVRPAPVLERGACRRDRAIDVLDATLRDLRDDAAVAPCDVVVGLAEAAGTNRPLMKASFRGWSDPARSIQSGRQAGGHAAYLLIETSSSITPRPGR